MWRELPLELQNAIIALAYAPDASGHVHPRLVKHVPSHQFLPELAELRHRLGCLARGRALANGNTSRNEISAFVQGVTRVAIDVTLLRVALPHSVALPLSEKVQHLVEAVFAVQGCNRMLWAAFGLHERAPHYCSVAAEAIHAANMVHEDRKRAVNVLDGLFCYLNKCPVTSGPGLAQHYRVRDVLHQRISSLWHAELRVCPNHLN